MRGIAGLGLALLVVGCGQARSWRLIEEQPDLLVYGDPKSIGQENGKTIVELRFFDPEFLAGAEESELSRYEADCTAGTMQRIDLAIYKGEALEQSAPDTADEVLPMEPGTVGGKQLEFACGGGRTGEEVIDPLADARKRLSRMGATR